MKRFCDPHHYRRQNVQGPRGPREHLLLQASCSTDREAAHGRARWGGLAGRDVSEAANRVTLGQADM